MQKGERIRAALVGATWTVVAAPHTANELEDVGFRVVSLVDTLPADADWQQGEIDAPGFPNTALWAELEAKLTASFQGNLTEDLYVARAWLAPSVARELEAAAPLRRRPGPRRRRGPRDRVPRRVRVRKAGRGA